MLLVACSGVGGQATSVRTTALRTATSQSTVTTVPAVDEGDLTGWETVSVTVGQEVLLVALANDPGERAQGLTGVEDFGDLDGMLFVFEQESFTAFWMKDTPVPLDIAFFDSEGLLVDVLTMEPCEADPCRVYLASGAFARALETPVGRLGELGSDARLLVGTG